MHSKIYPLISPSPLSRMELSLSYFGTFSRGKILNSTSSQLIFADPEVFFGH